MTRVTLLSRIFHFVVPFADVAWSAKSIKLTIIEPTLERYLIQDPLAFLVALMCPSMSFISKIEEDDRLF